MSLGVFKAKELGLFIAGYPKSGTSSLYDYLKSHPEIFFPDIKEPHFFSEDYPGAQEVETYSEYRNLYKTAGESLVLGDASASVIHSDVALDAILERFPKTKFILLVREPVAAVRSFHGELLHNLNENVKNFERAWNLQDVRKTGEMIPATCKEPRFLQYREIFNYRDQLLNFVNKVPEEQRLILVFEEFFSDPRSNYLKVLDFLGLNDDGRVEFGAKNTARIHRYRWLAELHGQMVKGNGAFYRFVKSILSRIGIHPSHLLSRFNRSPGGKAEINEQFEKELKAHFRDDVAMVERILGRHIESWEK